ncbi:dmX-like protein 2 isoform X2 [Mytilus californianus]|uniref:dmX-like protein 2 isoform X2 n=1 Tax=Mytilus californianus TaxID=6549 RepID=UPI002247CD64|nr:dmX-like protein 2 isoform X2 [Mytilus californianus]
MNRHQVLTGACNPGDQCYAVGSVEGIHFTAYAAGCDIVILASDFQRVQIIPGVTHGNIKVNCIDCSTDSGKIAASYKSKVYIFEPTPLLHHESTHEEDECTIHPHKLDYQWYQTALFEAESLINCLSWNLEGSRLLTGGDVIQIWHLDHEQHDEENKSVKFSVGDHEEEGKVHHPYDEDSLPVWDCIWSIKPASPVYFLKYSHDGLLFASAGQNDRLVKIWYEDRKISFPSALSRGDSLISPKKEELHYSFVYVAHPRTVTGFSWRKTSKFMPRGSVANMLVSSCADNVCRLWIETVLPDDGLVDLEQFDPSASFDPKYHTHRHKKRFMQRLKTIRHAIHKRRKHHKFGPETVMSVPHLDSMGTSLSVHDFHKFAIHQNGVCPTLHFHLAGSINPETDIPLLPVVNTDGDVQHNFQLHWLNNKELQFTMEAETILQEMHKGTMYEGQMDNPDFNIGSDSDPYSGHDLDDQVDMDVHAKKKKKKHSKKKHKLRKEELKLGNDCESQSSIQSNDGSDGTGSTPTSPEVSGSVIDALDRKIEGLLRDWHQSPDMLFSIHPIDGSFLVWLVDWLDEYSPYCFRQAQVSFSSRLPHAFPVADARTMATNLMLYCNYSKMDIKSAMRLTESRLSSEKIPSQPAPASGKSSPGQNDNMLIPNVLMISKHSNGSLNQWQISFSDTSKFSTVVSVAHASRACGHRFRTNNAACHPVLPLLLTTSHHNVPIKDSSEDLDTTEEEDKKGGIEFCSELILWRVDPVGPLSKSGGIVELARINAPDISAFIDVAWVPTLLPSSTLGTYSNSPSALFVASDGASLKMYQAVIDARTLLLDSQSTKREPGMSFSSNTSSGYSIEPQRAPGEMFNIISLQSSARPGCIIELEPLADAKQNWQKTHLLHVFQEQLLTGSPSGSIGNLEAIVDLSNSGNFSENFYLVVLQKDEENHGSTLHMWKITISSQLESQNSMEAGDPKRSYVPDYSYVDDDGSNPPSRSSTPEHFTSKPMAVVKLCFSTAKVYTKKLPLPDDVDIVSAEIAAGHLSSASIYPACLAPYLLVTACSDGTLRFWRCDLTTIEPVYSGQSLSHTSHSELNMSTVSFEYTMEEFCLSKKPSISTFTRSEATDISYNWCEWKMMTQADDSSAVYIPGKPIAVSCAYSGRLAIAYRMGSVKTNTDKSKGKIVNLYVAIYECESTGGSEWLLEDTIELKNISVPENNPEIDLNCIYTPNSPPATTLEVKEEDQNKGMSPSASLVNMNRLTHVPSMSTIFSVKKTLSAQCNNHGILQQKQLVQLDWVSTEDGSHILTVGVGSKILMYGQVSNDIVQSCQKAKQREKKQDGGVKSSHGFMDASYRRQNFVKSKSIMITNIHEDIQWMKLRSIELTTADGLPPLPMHLSWVRGGILVVGMDNEMHVYSQWRNSAKNTDVSEADFDKRTLDDASLTVYSLNSLQSSKSVAKLKPSYSMPSFKHLNNLSRKNSDSNLSKFNLSKSKSESTTSLSVIQEFGLFEAYRIANPVLPQYHPKLLMELLNSGKTRRVKAILSHLVRCISGGDMLCYLDSEEHDENRLTKPRTVSVSGGSPVEVPVIQEETQLDYKEISSIPALPMYALLAADEDNTVAQAEMINAPATNVPNQDYTNLFDTNLNDEELNVDVFSTSPENATTRKRIPSSSQGYQKPTYFGAGHSRLLTQHLTHTQLPGLTSLDQMYLLALADTVAHTKTDFADRFEAESKSDLQTAGTAESIDDCGLRFLLAIRHHIYLIRTLPPVQRAMLRQQGLRSASLVWAYHSESTEELLSYIPSMQKGEPVWAELKEFGAGWWINNINILKRTMEKVAKAAFQANKDPMDAAIYYLAMKKKSVLWGLYRSLSNKKMVEFFKQDFDQDRWRKAALKNAFDLLGKQRFSHAAAFFLLAGSLNDAVEVCLNNMYDIQLALVICRLNGGDDILPDSVKQILYTQILGCDKNGDNYDVDRMLTDPFLRSMSLWSMKDFRGSLNTLLQDARKPSKLVRNADTDSVNSLPSVFNFYNYLRTHPLLVRQRMANAGTEMRKKSVIPGFTRQQTVVLDDSSVVVDKVTPLERRLFFTTAHTHYKNGCPLLALEVLSKLPPVIENASSKTLRDFAPVSSSAAIETGTIDPFIQESEPINKSDSLDWGQPVTNGYKETKSSVDWSTPISKKVDSSDTIDWGAPSLKFDLEEPKFNLSFSSEESDSELDSKEQNGEDKIINDVPSVVVEDKTDSKDQGVKGHQKIDIFAQQYAFIACLKVLMEEMQTLATGFEVDGGQLRFQLYIWLEKEVEVLQFLSNYGNKDKSATEIVSPVTSKPPESPSDYGFEDQPSLDIPTRPTRSMSVRSDSSYKPTLHEVILAEKMDFQSKLERMANRKQWLKTHQQLLRTLASYCMLQGAGGGGLASVQMELLLLLQELQQEKTQQQLLSPLPFPTTLPLLSAAIASSKTVIADPIQHIQCMTQDLLHSVIEIVAPPGADSAINTIFTMRNLSIALSSCIYQCLCDCDSFVVSLKESNDASLEGFTSHNFTSSQAGHLMAGVQKYRRRSNTGDDIINTSPVKWPGVTSLRVLLAREKDEVAPKLNILLCESMIAVYISLLVNALAAYDCHMLYRLVAHRFHQQLWAALFGGGVKTALKLSSGTPLPQDDELSRQRRRLHNKVLGPHVPTKEKTTFKETFLPPELSMITFFMTKPFTTGSGYGEFNYDSEESLSSEEEDFDNDDEENEDDDTSMRPDTLNFSAVQQHTDPNSYSWCLIRYTIVKLVLNNLLSFLPVIGIELPELPVCSPLMHAVFKTLEQWLEMLLSKLDMFSGPPDEFLSSTALDTVQGQPHSKYQALLNTNNTPFIDNNSTLAIKRLWFHLIRQECLKEIFLRYVFGKRKIQHHDSKGEQSLQSDSLDSRIKEPMKIIHKEQDIITAFAINQGHNMENFIHFEIEDLKTANSNCLALSTQKEIIELDVGPVINPPVWLEDENEMDIEQFKNPDQGTTGEIVDFYVVQTHSDGQSQGNSSPQTGASTPTSGVQSTMTGRSTNMISNHYPEPLVILRRPVAGVRRIGSHPNLPHYLTGSTDGSVRLYEWGHIQPLAMLRQPGTFPKVTKVMFSSQGNKCCVSDSEGDVCLWQVGLGSNFNKPIMSLKCHNKTTSDVAFVGSSSLIATGGHSSESRNVCLWDTLLPPRSSCVHAFTCHEHGCPALVYAPHHQLLISGGRKGEICIFDIRQRQLRHTFQAHDASIRCLAIDLEEDYFVTGSSEGDVKVSNRGGGVRFYLCDRVIRGRC